MTEPVPWIPVDVPVETSSTKVRQQTVVVVVVVALMVVKVVVVSRSAGTGLRACQNILYRYEKRICITSVTAATIYIHIL